MKNELYVSNKLKLITWDKIPSDRINSVTIKFNFSEEWKDLICVAQFIQNGKCYNMVIDENDECGVPTELTAGYFAMTVFGNKTDDSAYRVTAIKNNFEIADSGYCKDGDTPIPPTPDLYEQLLKRFADMITVDVDQIYDALSKNAQSGVAVAQAVKGGVEEANRYTNEQIANIPKPVLDHSELINRDLPDQHTISSITGLQEELDKGVKIYSGTDLNWGGWAFGETAIIEFGGFTPHSYPDWIDNAKTGDFYYNVDEKQIYRILSIEKDIYNAQIKFERVSIEQAVIDYVAQEIAKIPQGDIDKPIHTTLNVEIEDDGFGGYRADYNDNDINNHRNAGGLVQAKYYNQAENQTYTYYYSTMESNRKPTFIRTFINADGKTEQVLASVGNDKKVSVERRISDGDIFYATCNAEAEPQQTTPCIWYVPKTMPKPSSAIGTMVNVKWVNGRVNGIGYDVKLIWGKEGGINNEVIVDTANTDGSTDVNIPTGGTILYQLIESNGRKRWKYVSGELIHKNFSTETSAEIADKIVPNLNKSYVNGMEIYLQLDNGNTADVMRLVSDEGTALPVYGNGIGAKTGAIEKGYILHLKNAGDHWQILNGGTSGGVSQEYVDSTFAPVIKNNASGEIIAVDDVSSVPHKVAIKCSSDTLTPQEIASANVLVTAKNQLKLSNREKYIGTFNASVPVNFNGNSYFGGITATGTCSNYFDVTFDQNGFTFSQKEKYFGIGFDWKPIKNKTYTLSYKCNISITTYVLYYGADKKLIKFDTADKLTFTIPNDAEWCIVIFEANSNLNTPVTISNVQIEFGSTATEYGGTYKPIVSYPIGDDLSVTVNSVSPNMTMYADKDGILLNASYNTDTKEYVNDNFVRLTEWELIDETIIPDGVLNTRQIEINKDLAKYKELLFVIGAGFSKLSDVPLSVKSKSSYYCWDTIKQIYTMTRNANWYIHINKMCSIDGKETIMISTLPNYLLHSSFSTGSFENQGLADAMATLRQDFNCYSKNFEGSFKIFIRSNDQELYFMPKSRFVLYGKE